MYSTLLSLTWLTVPDERCLRMLSDLASTQHQPLPVSSMRLTSNQTLLPLARDAQLARSLQAGVLNRVCRAFWVCGSSRNVVSWNLSRLVTLGQEDKKRTVRHTSKLESSLLPAPAVLRHVSSSIQFVSWPAKQHVLRVRSGTPPLAKEGDDAVKNIPHLRVSAHQTCLSWLKAGQFLAFLTQSPAQTISRT